MLSPERHRHHRHPPPPQPPPPPHHPPQPSHVVATIENLPAEGGSGGGRSGISAPSSSVRQRIRKVLNSLIVSPLYQVTQKKNNFKWGPEQQQAFEQIKQEIVHAVALGPVWAGPDVKNVLYTTARENGPTWSLRQKAPGETRGRPLGFWSRGYRGSKARYTPTEKEILAAYEGVRAASEVIGTEAQLLLAP
ncbi:hypothetical protein GRJ2_001121400 [Grus japonensis]|uniref:Reverse transcriptase/retrotransposon-derived protein RNase H-like domain-containing protein n=1 Tax=Grus japonensis TaxID=30415 RepID=A0ABC9WMX4_GRUJA